MSNKILVTGNSVRPDLLQPLSDAGFTVSNPQHLLSESELRDKLSTSCAYLLGGDEVATRAALSEAKGLKVIAFLGMGYESYVDATAATEMGIRITNTPGTLSNSVAELTIGHILNCTRQIHRYANRFQAGLGGEEKQHDVGAMRIGILGLGGIGTRLAGILRKGFNSQVCYSSRTRKQAIESELGIDYVSFEDLLSASDLIALTLPCNGETAGIIDSKAMSIIKPGCFLVNTARAQLVDPAALLSGLNSGVVTYAAFDGFYDDESEEVLQLKALQPEKLMVTGHVGSLTHEARDGMAKKAVQSLINVLTTGKDSCVVNL